MPGKFLISGFEKRQKVTDPSDRRITQIVPMNEGSDLDAPKCEDERSTV